MFEDAHGFCSPILASTGFGLFHRKPDAISRFLRIAPGKPGA
jgi:hypothetical protein